MKDGYMLFGYDRKRTSTLTLDSQPGAHTGATRKYIPGYSSANIVYLDTAAGNDAWTGANPTNSPAGTGPFLTYSAAATAASTTKKIRLVNSATLTANITKPTEATIGTTSTIVSSSLTAPVATWTSRTSGFGSTLITSAAWSPRLSLFVIVGAAGKIATSPDGITWTTRTSGFGSTNIWGVHWSEGAQLFLIAGDTGTVATSADGITWTLKTSGVTDNLYLAYIDSNGRLWIGGDNNVLRFSDDDGATWTAVSPQMDGARVAGMTYSDDLGLFVAVGNVSGNGLISTSSNGSIWTAQADGFGTSGCQSIIYVSNLSLFVVAGGDGKLATSPDGVTWTQRTSGFSGNDGYALSYSPELQLIIAANALGELVSSPDGITWTSRTSGFAGDQINSAIYSPLLGKYIIAGGAGKVSTSAAFGTTISAAVAGFSIQAVQYSGTVTAYNCTLKQPGTTAALSLDSCRVTESGSHISNNAATSTATLFEGDRHTTCTPASQNAIDCNLDTVGGTWYIYNASQTGYERIRDCLVEGGIVASYNVTVSGRANVRGTSANVLFGATVTFRDPKFIDTTDYKLQFQSNGYARNSLAAGRSALYFNSAGDARDIGAWSYVESNVTYYFAKNVYIPKGEITHSVEEVVSEQQGDSGAVSVYGNVNRIKEVITIKYTTEKEADLNVVRAMRLLTDKTVLIQLDPEWDANPGSVVANGAHSVGDDVLNIDATATYNGLTVTIAGKKYYPLRMEPNATATTRLILDRPLEDSVADNDVITRNYPTGAGEYQYSAQQRLDLARVDATVMRAYRTGFIIRLVRAYQ